MDTEYELLIIIVIFEKIFIVMNKPVIIPSKTNNKNMERYLHKKLSKVGEGGEDSSGGSIAPSDMRAIQKIIEDYLDAHPSVTGTFSNSAKRALLNILSKVAYIDTQGQDYLDNLRTLLFSGSDEGGDEDRVSSIVATFTPESETVIYDINSLDVLKNYLTVVANYTGGGQEEVSNYELSGTLSAGASVITVTYEGVTTTFSVSVVGTTKLYFDGDECTELTGGWQLVGYHHDRGTPVGEKESDGLLLKFETTQGSTAALTFSTVNAVDLTGKTKILVEYEAYNAGGNGKCWVYYIETLADSESQAGAFGSDYSNNREMLANLPVDGFSEFDGLVVRDIITQKTSVHICLNFNCFKQDTVSYSAGAFYKVKKLAIV